MLAPFLSRFLTWKEAKRIIRHNPHYSLDRELEIKAPPRRIVSFRLTTGQMLRMTAALEEA